MAQRLLPPPPAFEPLFIEGGWRLVERALGHRPSVVKRFLNYLGRRRVLLARRERMKAERKGNEHGMH